MSGSAPTPSTSTIPSSGLAVTNTQWLGANCLVTARDENSINGLRTAIKKEDRSSLAPKELYKVQLACQKGVKTIFSMMALSDQSNKTSIKGVYDVQTRLDELKKAIQDDDMHDVFMIASEFEKDATGIYIPKSTATQLDLFTVYTEVDLETVKHWNAYCLAYGPTYMAQNLAWGMEKILNSCDDYLRTKILESVNKYSVMHRGSIVVFKHMITLIISTSNSSLRSMTNRMTNLRITDFDGENVAEAVSFFRGGRTILSNNNFEPPDFDNIIFDSFKASSTPEFNALVSTMQTNKALGVPMVPVGLGTTKSVDSTSPRDQIDDCLQALENHYMNLVSKSKWLAKSNTHQQDSSFNIQSKTNDNSTPTPSNGGKKLICFNCGKDGHGYPDCDIPLDQDRIKRNRAKFLQNRSNPSGFETPSSRSATTASRTGGGKDLSIIPPNPGKPHVRILGSGKILYWCATCGKWNESHETRYHSSENALSAQDGDGAKEDTQSHSGATLTTQSDDNSTDLGGVVRGSFGPPHFI